MTIRKLKKQILLFKEKMNMLSLYCHDIKKAMKYSLFNQDTIKGDKLQAMLLISIHGIEKGLSFEHKKSNWGGQKILRHVSLLEQYYKEFGLNEIFAMGVNALNAYKSDEYSSTDQNIRLRIDRLLDSVNSSCCSKDMIGVKEVTKPDLSICYDELLAFAKSRSSVRYYSDEPITKEEIDRAIAFAQQTPSACNRQSCKVYAIQDKKLKEQLINSQHGDQGWCLGADTIFVVTTNQSYFNATWERYEMFVDGGLYAMNLVYGLHVQGVATCFKMYNKAKQEDSVIQKLCGMSPSEVPVILILAGHYRKEGVHTPLSHRLNFDYEKI